MPRAGGAGYAFIEHKRASPAGHELPAGDIFLSRGGRRSGLQQCELAGSQFVALPLSLRA